MIIELPYPPSLNSYYRHVGSKVMISKNGRLFRDQVNQIAILDNVQNKFNDKDLQVVITLYPPDRRKRDIDNVLKCLFDSLTHAKVWHDDSQVKRMFVEKNEPIEQGLVIVKIMEYQNDFFQHQSMSQFFDKICGNFNKKSIG